RRQVPRLSPFLMMMPHIGPWPTAAWTSLPRSPPMPEQIFTNARLVTATDVLRGTIAVRDGLIHDVCESASSLPHAQDMNGDYLMPGFVELHTDNLEKFMNPRP